MMSEAYRITYALVYLIFITHEGVLSSKRYLWVSSIRSFSSQWDTTCCSADRVIGPPDVYPSYGDLCGAWAPEINTGYHHIEVEFEYEIHFEEVNIYETWNSGGVKRLEILAPDFSWTTIWTTTHVQHIESSRIFSPSISISDFPSKVLRLTLDSDVSLSWVEIDAIQIIGPETISVSTERSTEAFLVSSTAGSTDPNMIVSTVRLSETSSVALTSTEGTTDANLMDTTYTPSGATTEQDKPFKCCCSPTTNITQNELHVILQEIRKNLTLPKNQTGRYNRSMHSADDYRQSSAILGTTFAVVTLVILLCPVLIFDIQFVFRIFYVNNETEIA